MSWILPSQKPVIVGRAKTVNKSGLIKREELERLRQERYRIKGRPPERKKSDLARLKAWNSSNPDKAKEARRRWNRENSHLIVEANRRWRANNPEKSRQTVRDYKLRRKLRDGQKEKDPRAG